jgi:hypothetical protein
VLIYDVPFAPTDAALWQVSSKQSGERRFETREHALAYATRAIQAAARTEPGGAFVNIEGADGTWRLFDPELRSVP